MYQSEQNSFFSSIVTEMRGTVSYFKLCSHIIVSKESPRAYQTYEDYMEIVLPVEQVLDVVLLVSH